MLNAKNLQKILQAGTLLSFLTIFLVSSVLLFPYITSKQLAFNIIIEILLPVWLILLWRYPQYRPKRKLVAYGLIAYLAAILLSCFFSVDFNLSFWGDAERMLGWFHLSHYFLLYFYLLAAWRSQSDWRFVLGFFVCLGVIQALFYLSGDNRIGNTAYLSAYLLFNLFLAAILFVKTRSLWRYAYLLAFLPLLLAFFQARTSGAIFGLTLAVLLFLALLGIFMTRRLWRTYTLSALVCLVVVIVVLFSQSNQAWFQQNRLLRGLTFDKPTFQTRLVSWEGAVKEFPNQPILGVGYGNYAIIFDKQFDSRFLDYARTETYFDRAHNNIIDITATTGLIGLITYLSIFVALIFYLWHLFKVRGTRIEGGRAATRSIEILLLVALLAAYFIQNLAVFDTQTTYLALMLVLAYITYLAEAELRFKSEAEIEKKETYLYRPLNSRMKIGLVLVGIFSFFLVYSINYQTWQVFEGTVYSYGKIVNGEVEFALTEYRNTLTTYSPIKRDARSILINFFIKHYQMFTVLSTERMLTEIDYIISLAKENLEYNQRDSRKNLNLSQVLVRAAQLRPGQEAASVYLNQALEAINQAIESSPNRAPLYLNQAQIYLNLEDYQAVKDSLKQAISLNDRLPDGYCNLAQVKLALAEQDQALTYLEDCLVRQGIRNITLDSLLVLGLETYQAKEDYETVLIILNRLTELKPEEVAVYLELTKTHLYLNNPDQAILAGKKLVELAESVTDASDLFISLANDKLNQDKVDLAILAAEIAAQLNPDLEAALVEFMADLEKEGLIDGN